MPVNARIFFFIQQLEQMARQRLDEQLVEDGVTAGQYLVLNLIVHHEPTSSAFLARRAGMTAQSMGEFIKTLETKGLVERSGDPNNRRVIIVSSTPAGRALLVRCETKIDAIEAEFFHCLSPEEIATLRLMLSRVRTAELARRG